MLINNTVVLKISVLALIVHSSLSWAEVGTYENQLYETNLLLEELILQNVSDTPEEIKACVQNGIKSIEAITEPFTGPKKRADCSPGELPSCSTKDEEVSLTVILDSSWKIEGDLKVIDYSSSRKGWFTDPTILNDITVEAFAKCHGNGCSGTREWAEGYIVGIKRRVVTKNDVRHIVGNCIQSFGAKQLIENYRKE